MKYFIYALTLAFIVLKLTGFIDWSWWLVWLPLVIWYGIVLLLVILGAVSEINKARNKSVTDFKITRKSRFQERLDQYVADQNKSK